MEETNMEKALKLDKKYLMSIISENLDETELAELAYKYADDTSLLKLDEKVISSYEKVDELWEELDVETQDDILINNNWGEEFTEEELLSEYDVKDLWEELDKDTRTKIVGNTLGTNYATSIIEKNTNIQDLIEMLIKYTGLALEDIINYKER